MRLRHCHTREESSGVISRHRKREAPFHGRDVTLMHRVARRGCVAVAASVLGVFAVAGCGGQAASGDTAGFEIRGTVISTTENGTVTIRTDGAPPMDYSGPVGCRGRYFNTDDAYGLPLDFRYSAHDVYLYAGATLYHLGAPIRRAGALRWSATVDGSPSSVTVYCPLPSPSLPAVSAGFPTACELLTRAIAARELGRKVGPAQLTHQSSFDTFCSYETNDLRLVSLDVSDAATTKSETSWRSSPVGGLGVPAHAPTPTGSLVAIKGDIGIEVVVSLGGSQGADTTAEVRVARAVLAEMAG